MVKLPPETFMGAEACTGESVFHRSQTVFHIDHCGPRPGDDRLVGVVLYLVSSPDSGRCEPHHGSRDSAAAASAALRGKQIDLTIIAMVSVLSPAILLLIHRLGRSIILPLKNMVSVMGRWRKVGPKSSPTCWGHRVPRIIGCTSSMRTIPLMTRRSSSRRLQPHGTAKAA